MSNNHINLSDAFESRDAARRFSEVSTYLVDKKAVDIDVYGQGASLQRFEKYIVGQLGTEDGMFLISGVMACLIAMRVAHGKSEQPKLVALHPYSHILLHEHDAYREVFGFEAVLCGVLDRPLSFADVEAMINTRLEKHLPLPSSLHIEIPSRYLGGQTTSLDDLKRIQTLCSEHNVHIHMDGARLWEVQPHYKQTLAQVSSFADSVYVSFYKGLNGMAGAMLCGKESFITEARIWLRRMGGNVYSYLPYYATAQLCVSKYIKSFESRYLRLCKVVDLISTEFKADLNEMFYFYPSQPSASMIHVCFPLDINVVQAAHDALVADTNLAIFKKLRPRVDLSEKPVYEGYILTKPESCVYFEWNMGPLNAQISDTTYIRAWAIFLDHITALTDTMRPSELDAFQARQKHEQLENQTRLEKRRNLIFRVKSRSNIAGF